MGIFTGAPRSKQSNWSCDQGIGKYALVSLLSLASIFGGCSKKKDHDEAAVPRAQDCGLVLPQVFKADNQQSFEIPVDRYLHYRQINKSLGHSPKICEAYCKSRLTPDEPIIREIAGIVTRGLERPEDKANRLLQWVRTAIQYDYVEKESGGDYHRFPVETLEEKRGDGEDAAYLYASLCLSADISVILVHYDGHIACAVEGKFEGVRFFERGRTLFVAFPSPNPEFGPSGALKVGTIPAKYDGKSASLYMSHLPGTVWATNPSGETWYFFIPYPDFELHRDWRVERSPSPGAESQHLAFLTPNNPTIKALAEFLTKGIEEPLKKAAALRRFVKENITYKKDPETKGIVDYHRYPIETLSEHCGDCEDTAYLLLSLCEAAGLDGCLLRFDDHMAVGLRCETTGTSWAYGNKKYYFVESTGDREEVGNAWKYASANAWVYPARKDR